MTYTEWSKDNLDKRAQIEARLVADGLTSSEIIDYFDFDLMKINEPEYCGLYCDNKKCHNIPKLNCYFCGCPYFIYDDNGISQQDGKTVYSTCSINAILGSQFISEDAIHHDCSKCDIPHRAIFAKRMINKHM